MPEIENKAEIIHSAQAKSTVAVPIVRSRAFPLLAKGTGGVAAASIPFNCPQPKPTAVV